MNISKHKPLQLKINFGQNQFYRINSAKINSLRRRTKHTLDEFYKPDDGPYEPPRTKKEFNILNLNYPTITVPYIQIGHPVVLIRTVENVGCPGKYRVKVTAPSELKVDVEPQILAFKFVGEKKQFRVTLTLRDTPETDGYVFGMLVWMDGSRHKVNTPIIVRYS